jgi:hypothetical protein
VHSGAKTKIDYRISLTPECVVAVPVEVTVVKPPSHGTFSTQLGTTYPTYPKENVRYDCNRQPAASVDLMYQSDPGYQGKDLFTIEVQSYARHAVPGTVSYQSYEVEVR